MMTIDSSDIRMIGLWNEGVWITEAPLYSYQSRGITKEHWLTDILLCLDFSFRVVFFVLDKLEIIKHPSIQD